jgi:nucleotide-binding universal stress UspA family protein
VKCRFHLAVFAASAIAQVAGILPVTTPDRPLLQTRTTTFIEGGLAVRPIARIVCAVDIDDDARTAFEQALALARIRDAKLLLVCAVPPEETFSRRATDRVAYLRRLRTDAERAGIEVYTSVQTGEPAEVLLLHAKARRADLIVISVEHGRARGRGWGALAEDVLRSAPCSTLVVPAGAANLPAFTRIVWASDLASEMRLGELRGVADARDHTVTVLHVARARADAKAALQQVQRWIGETAPAPALGRVAVGAVGSEVIKVMRDSKADLLVIGARRRNRVSRRFFGVTRELLTTSQCPVLAIPIDGPAARQVDEAA